MNRLIALTDYKGKFGSKHFDNPYRSGFNKELLSKCFAQHGFQVEFRYFHEIDLNNNDYRGKSIIYTSSEDIGYYYKSYIEDIVLSLELAGANLLPGYKHLRANNNKVFMEILRSLTGEGGSLLARSFGSLKDLEMNLDQIQYPCVLKESEGASGRGVHLIRNKHELVEGVKKISTSRNLKEDIKDYLRSFIHKGYIRESRNRNKFVVQDFIPNLKNDWKIYIFGKSLYIFNRPILKGRGIKASGGGYDNYKYGPEAEAPEGIFDYAFEIYKKLDVPHVSLDIAFDGTQFYLIEFQSVYFGTAGIPYSDGYYQKQPNGWSYEKDKLEIEFVYAAAISHYLKTR